MEDTCFIVGSEAYTAALLVYSVAKASGKEAGLDEAIDPLDRQFARKTCTNRPGLKACRCPSQRRSSEQKA